MNFRDFLEVVEMDPFDAMQLLGLSDKAGQLISEPELMAVWKTLARQNHPDVNDSPDATQKMKDINNAMMSLKRYTLNNQPLPTSAGARPNYSGPSQSQQRPTPNAPTEDRPANAQTHTAETLHQWATQAATAGFFQVDIYEKAKQLSMLGDISHGTVGRKERTFQLKKHYNEDSGGILKAIEAIMSMDSSNYPDDIVWAQTARHGSWVTYIWQLSQDEIDFNKRVAAQMRGLTGRGNAATYGYRSIYFKPKPVPKDKSLGMPKDAVYGYFRQELSMLPGRTNDTYFGMPEHASQRGTYGYLIKLQPKMALLVHRFKVDYYGKQQAQEVKLQSIPYGQLTQETLEKMVRWVKARYEKYGLGDTSGAAS